MSILRAIGDIHGCIDNRLRFNDIPSYIELCQQLSQEDYSIQVGDMGFIYSSITKNLDSSRHVFLKGNHDIHDEVDCPNVLGRFGYHTLGPFSFFYISGGFSLDKKWRIQHEIMTGQKTYWKNEELSQEEGLNCLSLYEDIKPDVVFSHDGPAVISDMLGSPDFVQAFGYPRNMITSTQKLLQQMLNIHKPNIWCLGHYHRNWNMMYKGCNFYCISERDYIDFDESWTVVGKSFVE